jgi:hypothetical protein
MAAANYCLRGDLSDEMQVTDPNEDARLDRAITDASRVVDAWANQRPGTFAPQTLTRVFDVGRPGFTNIPGSGGGGGSGTSNTPGWDGAWGWAWGDHSSYELPVLPLTSVSALASDADGDGVYETIWTPTTHFLLWPRNQEVKRRIDRNAVSGGPFFPHGQARVQITGTWGILEDSQTPTPIRRATLLLAMIYYRRPSNAPNSQGLGGAAVQIGYTDVDIAAILWRVAGKYKEQIYGA